MTSSTRPAPFSVFTTPEFWNDPHISARMLANHLDPANPMASRPHEFIDRSVEWLIPALHLQPGARLLDLGCGPGLYAQRCANRGIQVFGVDVSTRALAYARDQTRQAALPITYRQGDYLTGDIGENHDTAILIYEDYSALSPAQRALLLSRVHDALRPGGRILFDATSAARFPDFADSIISETNLMDGFWAEPPYLGTHETWTYPDQRLVLDRYTIKTNRSTQQFWNWMHCLTPEEVTTELTTAGFTPTGLHADVTGSPYTETGPTFAMLAQRE